MAEPAPHAAVTSAGTQVPGHSGGHVEPTAWGLSPTGWVALAMIAVFAILLWKRVPAAIGKALDARIAAIRAQLDQASSLRREAEALREEYRGRAATAEAEAAAMIARAQEEARSILAKADADAAALVERRTRMAEDKIAAEERAAIAALRSSAVDAATSAAARLIAERNDAASDAALIDRAIEGLARTS